MTDKEILRELAYIYSEYAFDKVNDDIKKIHKSVNDLAPIRPLLLIEELPWHELNFDDFLTLSCQDEENRKMERYLRANIHKRRHFGADMIFEPFIRVQKLIEGDFMGLDAVVERKKSDENNNVSAQHYKNLLESEEDIKKLHNVNILYLEKETKAKFEHFSEIFKDIIPVKITGIPTSYNLSNKTWDIISQYMGVNDLLYNMIDEPEFMHKLVRVLTDISVDRMKQFEALGLLDEYSLSCQGASTLSDQLPKANDGEVKCKNVWGRGLAQILTSVSPSMVDEFEVAYATEALQDFGFVYYGCCEALDNKIDILKKIKNLRKISISPWADMRSSAEQIGKDYVISAKPNPAIVSGASLDIEQAKQEIKTMINSSVEYDCSLEIVLKDISTVSYTPKNLIEWNKLVMSMIS